jgi:methyl coenzyme M reductase subunit C-like uncharacterized protein (methanogenesis marker protein 7)
LNVAIVGIALVVVAVTMVAPTTAKATSPLPEFFCSIAEYFNWQSAGANFICYTMMELNDSWDDPLGNPHFGG